MIKSGETIRLEIVQHAINGIEVDLKFIDSQLGFVQGDEINEVASDSVSKELRQIRMNLLDLGQWVTNALVTMQEIDAELSERSRNRA